MILENFVMLGKTVPEVNGDGRIFVCTAGYDLELRQPVRVYPMARKGVPARWARCRIPLERNPKDHRPESWQIRGDRSLGAHEDINSVIEVIEKKVDKEIQKEIVDKLTVSSIDEANKKRMSLCVLLPSEVPELRFDSHEAAEWAPTPDMFGWNSSAPVKARFKHHPRLYFKDKDGSHKLMLRDWGCYELMRKIGDDALSMMGEALNLSTAAPLLCGNFNRFRNSWLVISIFSGVIHARPHVIEQQFAFL